MTIKTLNLNYSLTNFNSMKKKKDMYEKLKGKISWEDFVFMCTVTYFPKDEKEVKK